MISIKTIDNNTRNSNVWIKVYFSGLLVLKDFPPGRKIPTDLYAYQ